MDGNDNGSSAGVTDPTGQSGSPAQGGQAGDSTAGGDGQGTPGNQNGQPTDPRDAEISKYKTENQRLNRILAQRSNRRSPSQVPQPGNQGGEQGSPFESPEGQYGIAIQLATNQLRGSIEDVFPHYPEIPSEEIARVRKNPWAFASHDAFIRGDWQQALEDIEYALLDRAEALKGSGADGGTGTTPPNSQPKPAQVNNNPATLPETPADPGTNEDSNPWTMPMDKLEREANKEVARKKAAKQQ